MTCLDDRVEKVVLLMQKLDAPVQERCPFCGSIVRLFTPLQKMEEFECNYTFFCEHCRLRMEADSLSELLTKWNRRAQL